MLSPLAVVAEIINWLWVSQSRAWRSDTLREGERELHEQLTRSFRPFGTDRELEAALKRIRDGHAVSFDSRVIILWPTTRGDPLVPVLTAEFENFEPWPRARIYLALFEAGTEEPRSVGFRFESPEGEGPGTHSYYHAQPIRKFAGKQLPGGNEYVPESTPAFPLDATNTVELVVCAIVSIYGADIIEQMLREIPTTFKSYAEQMLMWETRFRFWRVTIGPTDFLYMTRSDDDVFKRTVAQVYRGARFALSDADSYYRADPNLRRRI